MRYERPGQPQPQILVASAPGDPRAIRLVDDLLDLGWDVILADTPELAEEFAAGAICIAVLRPRYWNAPPIAATVQSNPPYLIPVLAEPMPLPRGPWSFEPIPMESPRQVVSEVATALEDGFRALSWRRPSRPNAMPHNSYPTNRDPYRSPRDSFSSRGDDFAARSMPSRPSVRVGVASRPSPLDPLPAKQRSGGGRVAGTLLSLLVIAGLLFGGYKYGLLTSVKKLLGKGGTSTSLVATQPVAYSAATPGPNCDKGGGSWEALNDSSLAGTCQTDGFLLTKNGSFDTAGEIFFDGKNHAPFPTSYQVQLTAAITSGDAHAGVGVEVHRQTPKGGQIFDVQSSQWVFTLDDKNGDPPKQLATGFMAKSTKPFALTVTVTGGEMVLTINGTKVDTVLDATFNTTDSIALALVDPGATKPVSALFSQFSYTPLTTPALAPTDIAATATAQAKSTTPYKATVPGPGCDKGVGQWDPTNLGDPTTTIKCLATGLQINQTVKATNVGEVRFYDLDGNFPANYKLDVTADMSNLVDGGIGFFMRTNSIGSYHIYVYRNGDWRMLKRTFATGNSAVLNAGNVGINSANPVQMEVSVSGNKLTLSINGTQVASATDASAPLIGTDYVSLVLNAALNPATVIYSNFIFTPLP